jgi:hypothetical protein
MSLRFPLVLAALVAALTPQTPAPPPCCCAAEKMPLPPPTADQAAGWLPEVLLRLSRLPTSN